MPESFYEFAARVAPGRYVAATDEGRRPRNGETLEEHLKHCQALFRCPFLPSERDRVDATVREDVQSKGSSQHKNRLNETKQERARREYDEIVKRFSNRDGSRKSGWMKAPNGAQTKLTERQWVVSRTDSFKEEYGDWELLYRADPKKVMAAYDFCVNGKPVAAISGKEFPKNDRNDLIDRVTKYYQDCCNGYVDSPEIGRVVLNRRSVHKSLSHGMSDIKCAAFALVPTVLKNGMVFDYAENWKARGRDTYALAAPVLIGGRDYVCEIVVDERFEDTKSGRKINKGKYFYLHSIVVKERVVGALTIPTGGTTPTTPARPDESILAHAVRTVNGECRLVLDRDGEPMTDDRKGDADFGFVVI